MYFVYVLRSLKDNKNYTGSTENVAKRLKEHNAGKTESTRRRRPFELVYQEEFNTREEAEAREKYLKSGKGREELKLILDTDE
ncbi:MAG: GIY-YIG nuclease family protein [Bacteroidota bacterium]